MNESNLPNDALQSQLSAFVDNELPQSETELLARRLARESELQQTMGRYLLMGEAMRAPRSSVSRDFSLRVAAAIAQDAEAAVSAAGKIQPQRGAWLKSAAGMSLAAGVAVVTVMAVHSWQAGTITSPTVAQNTTRVVGPAAQALSQSAPGNSYVVPTATSGPALSVPIPSARLTNYVVAHSEFTTPLGRHNMMTGLITNDLPKVEATEEVSTAQ